MAEILDKGFTVEEGTVTEAPDIGTLAVLNKSEIDQQIATAKRYPRSIVNFRKEALQLATLDEQTAAECIYALPRDGKTIEGPSARFAEIINYAWGNTRAGARTISEDGDFVKSQGLFYDLEKNTAISYEVSRRITGKGGKRYSADMIGTTSNAACSIALRNAILKGIPKALWKPIYDASRKVVAGDIRTLANRRSEAIKAFSIFGVTPEMIFATLGVKGVEDITIDQLVVLKGIHTAIQEGDTTPEQAFAAPHAVKDDFPDEKVLREEADRLLHAQQPQMNTAQREAAIGRFNGHMQEFVNKLKEFPPKGNGTGTAVATPEGGETVTPNASPDAAGQFTASAPRESVAQPSGSEVPSKGPVSTKPSPQKQSAPASKSQPGFKF